MQAYILITDNGDAGNLATFVMPPWNKTLLLDFQQWNASAGDVAKFIRGAQEKALQANLPVVLDEGILDGLIGLFVKGYYEPVLIIRRDRSGTPEVALQVCDKDGISILDVTCAKIWHVAQENFESTVRDMVDRIYKAAVRNGIDCVSSTDLVMYLPEGDDLAGIGEKEVPANVQEDR